VSAKHTIVPRGFALADLDHRFDPEKFQRVTGRQARALAQAGTIRQLGDSGKVWQLTEISITHSDYETGKGRVSLEIPFALQSFVTSEMRRRPSWDVMIEA
jgi:hypothetical protein